MNHDRVLPLRSLISNCSGVRSATVRAENSSIVPSDSCFALWSDDSLSARYFRIKRSNLNTGLV